MINQMNQSVGGDAAPRSDANSPALQSMQPERTAAAPPLRVAGMADVQALEAHIERRRKLAARIRLESPSRTEEEIEARLEQFGA
jgi:hypothetical protein